MSKIKPNQPCYCGSGRKYKKCCGTVAEKSIENEKSSNKPQLEGTWGISGTEIILSILRHYSDPNDPRNSAHPGGTKGKYKVSFVLSKPNYAPLEENHITVVNDDVIGNSHLFIGNYNELRCEFETVLPEGRFIFYGYANEQGFLHKIEIEELEAADFKDAMLKAYNALAPTLSRISLLLDIPLHIYQTVVIELSTQNIMRGVSLPYIAQMPPTFTNYQLDKNLFKFTSLYREALNSNSPNYQYLCFYKIIEGIRKIRDERTTMENQEILARGETPPSRPVDRIPSDRQEQKIWLNSIFRPQKWSDLALAQVFPEKVIGRKINDLINKSKELDTVRNKIAHTVMRDETQETYSLDDGLQISEVITWLPLCKCLAIYLLKKEYPQLYSIQPKTNSIS